MTQSHGGDQLVELLKETHGILAPKGLTDRKNVGDWEETGAELERDEWRGE